MPPAGRRLGPADDPAAVVERRRDARAAAEGAERMQLPVPPDERALRNRRPRRGG
jgi:hypothetical protein